MESLKKTNKRQKKKAKKLNKKRMVKGKAIDLK